MLPTQSVLTGSSTRSRWGNDQRSTTRRLLAIVVRAENFLGDSVYLTGEVVDTYHGGDLGDEISSLLSVALGIRCRSGGTIRTFGEIDDDPRGRPQEFTHRKPYLAPWAVTRPTLPRLACTVNLADAEPFLRAYLRLGSRDATALVKAARLYEQATWVTEDDPNLAWLQLVSAIEVLADRDAESRAASPVERLTLAMPKLIAAIAPCGEEVVAAVAAMLDGIVKSTAKFLTFTDAYLPHPPAERPHVAVQVTGQRCRAIYERSTATGPRHCTRAHRFRIPCARCRFSTKTGLPTRRRRLALLRRSATRHGRAKPRRCCFIHSNTSHEACCRTGGRSADKPAPDFGLTSVYAAAAGGSWAPRVRSSSYRGTMNNVSAKRLNRSIVATA